MCIRDRPTAEELENFEPDFVVYNASKAKVENYKAVSYTHLGLGNDELVEGMTAAVGLDLAQRCGLRGSDVAGSNAVALDVVCAVLRSDVLGEHLQAALRCV